MITLTREEAQQVLDALQELNKLSIGENAICLPAEIDNAMETLRARLAQPEREWQGLTYKERNDCLVEADPCEALLDHEAHELMRTVEAKLKEKNT